MYTATAPIPAPKVATAFANKSETVATTILAAGPAKAVIAIPSFSLLKLRGLICTGFAQPTPKRMIHKAPI